MRIHLTTILIGVCLIMSGCMTAEEKREYDAAQYQERMESSRGICEEFGFKTGTSAMAECVQTAFREVKTEDERRSEKRRRFFAALGAGAESLQRSQDAAMSRMSNNRQVTTDCRSYGNRFNCTSR